MKQRIAVVALFLALASFAFAAPAVPPPMFSSMIHPSTRTTPTRA